MGKKLLVLLIGCVFILAGLGYSAAYDGEGFIHKGTSHGIDYLTGGVGLKDRMIMKEMEKDYNLKLVFATTSGNYLAKVHVDILDSKGEKIIEIPSKGPWLFVKLPYGEYMISVTHLEQKKAWRVKVGKGLKTVMFHWKE